MEYSINAAARTETGRATNNLRAQDQVPGVVYGFEIEPVNLTVDRNTLERLYTDAGESTVIDLKVGQESYSVLIQDIQRDPLTDFITHIDFRKIDLTQKVETTIPIELIGESAAVKELGGTLIQSLDAVEVEALPNALVRELELDISALETFDDVLRVSDLTIPEGMEIHTTPERSVATVQPPRTQAEMDALDEAIEADVSEVEVESEVAEEGEAGEATEEKTEEGSAEGGQKSE